MTIDVNLKIKTLKPSLWGKIIYYCLPFRRRVVFENMQRVFGQQLDRLQIKKLAQCFYSHLAKMLSENVQLRFLSEKRIRDKVVVVGEQYPLAAIAQQKGALILTGHFGNWELAPIGGILNFKAYQRRLHIIRRTIGLKWLEKILFRRFYKAGLFVIPKRHSLNQVCQAIEQNDAVVFIMDQHASTNLKDGIWAKFFGYEVGTYRSLASIARYTNAPVIPATGYRREDGKHVLEFFPPLPWLTDADAEQEILKNTEQYNRVLEQLVLAHPEQWLWLHRRFKKARAITS